MEVKEKADKWVYLQLGQIFGRKDLLGQGNGARFLFKFICIIPESFKSDFMVNDKFSCMNSSTDITCHHPCLLVFNGKIFNHVTFSL